MERKKKMILVCHCILNANSKVEGLASYSSSMEDVVYYLMKQGIGMIQLPCPEMTLYGIKRWGHVKEQFDTPYYRKHCKSIFLPYLEQIQDYLNNGYKIVGLIGLDGSPSCGVSETCSGNWCGEIMNESDLLEKMKTLQSINASGVFIEEIKKLLQAENIDIPFIGIDEMDEKNAMESIKNGLGER